MVKLLLSHKADVNLQNEVYIFFYIFYFYVVKLLLSHKADVNLQNEVYNFLYFMFILFFIFFMWLNDYYLIKQMLIFKMRFITFYILLL